MKLDGLEEILEPGIQMDELWDIDDNNHERDQEKPHYEGEPQTLEIKKDERGK